MLHTIMKLLRCMLCLCLASALAHQVDEPDADHKHHNHDNHLSDHLDPCDGLEMDAVALNEEGVPYFFKGGHVFKGFGGHAEMTNKSFPEVDDHHHMGHIDAAFRMHHDGDSTHNNIFLILDDMVYSYYQYKLEEGYPKNMSEVFPGIPEHLDAAVECPKPECDEHSVIFIKGHDVYHFNVKTKAVEKKEFGSMPNCTSAFRFMEHYYCFHGYMFSKFDPKTGEVQTKQPKDVRDYFMRCSYFSKWINSLY